MYETYYNLNAKPFQITTDPRFIWLGEKHSEALATLKYGILENKGFLLLTGDVGTGKTALIHHLVKMIDVAAIVATVPDPGLESLDFFNFLAVEFEMNKKFNTKGAFLIELKQFLHKADSSHKKVLLIVDEAQRLNGSLLEEIRLLSNIEMENRKLINIFFVGQSEFNEMLTDAKNKAIRQRITISYHIEPLTEPETEKYIKHRLKVAGATREIFQADAVHDIFVFSRGYPRLINIICDHALLTGYASGLETIDTGVIKECERELEIPTDIQFVDDDPAQAKDNQQPTAIETASEKNSAPPAPPSKVSFGRIVGVLATVIMLIVLGGYFFFNLKSGDAPRWAMDEIAPQKYQGPTPDKNDSAAVANIQSNDTNETQPTQDLAADENTAKQQPQKEITSNTEEKQQADQIESVSETPKVSDSPDAGGKQELVSLPERKFLIYFKHNSNELSDESFEVLNRIAGFMLQNPTASISIAGYTDSSGSYSYNVSVSQFRANIIKTFLVGKGVNPSKIAATGLGPENPIASNATAEGRQKNRRVEIDIILDQSS
ncbi:MAG: AAA family ATPase [Desulfobacterales bacterium]|jgi:general secretion pathway protein A